MNDGDVQFITKFDLTLTHKGVVVTDDINYTGLGENINNFRGVITVSGPQGTIYENTDYDNPDITPGSSRESVIAIPLPLDPQTEYQTVLKGNYTVRYTVRDITIPDDSTAVEVYSYQFDEPEIETTISSGPYSGILRSNDDTDYGSNITTLTREHRIQYPDELAVPPADVVSSNAYVEVTPIYTNEWTIIITSEVEYTHPDDLLIKWSGTETFTHCVYEGCIDGMYDAVETLRDNFQTAILNDRVQAEEYERRLVLVNTSWHLLNIAYQDGDVAEADEQAAVIAEQIAYTGSGTCGGPTSSLVIACPAFSGGGAPATYTFTNGITEVAGVVRLGGTLIQNTAITMAGYSYALNASDGGQTASHEVSAASGIINKASDGTVEGRVYAEPDKVTIERAHLGTPANTRGYEITADGLVEKADYTAGYVDRSLVSKSYVDSVGGGLAAVSTDATLSGDGTPGDVLSVVTPFPGFTSLLVDYGYTEPTHAFSEITATPTTLAGYGITDAAATFLDLTDAPGTYAGQAGLYPRVNSGESALEFVTGDWVPAAAGGTFSGQVMIEASGNPLLILRQTGVGGSPGTPQAGLNQIYFQDSDGDVQGIVGIDASGNIILQTNVSGQAIALGSDVSVTGNLSVTGNIAVAGTVDGVDIAAFKTAYDSHSHAFADITSKPTILSGYGITDAMLNTANSWDAEFSVKASATASDLVVIEDVADSNSKKYLAIGNLPTSAATFLALTDSPSSFSGQAGYVLKANTAENALEFDDISGDFISTTAATLTALSEKVLPVDDDVILIEDSEDSGNQKKLAFSNLPGSASSFSKAVSFTSCTYNATTNINIGTTSDITFLIHYTSNRDIGTVQGQSGTILVHYDSVAGTVRPPHRLALGSDLDFDIEADESGGDIRLNIIVGNVSVNSLNFDYKIYSKFTA